MVAAVPARRGGEPLSEPLLRRSLLLREEGVPVGDDEEGDCGPMGITPVNTRFEAASARSVRPRVRQR